jgi:O-antigen ligase
VIALAIYLTQSRGGFLALALSVAIFFVLARKHHRRLALGAPVLVVALLVVAPGGGERLGTLRETTEAAQQGGDQSLVGRFVMGRVALSVFADHPATGVGTGNFDLVSPDYQRRMGLAVLRRLGSHDVYLEMAAESGLLGLASWILFYGSALFVVARAKRVFERLPPDDGSSRAGQLVSAGVLAGLGGWAFASFFLDLGEMRFLTVAIALGVALDIEARRIARRVGESQRGRPAFTSADHPAVGACREVFGPRPVRPASFT